MRIPEDKKHPKQKISHFDVEKDSGFCHFWWDEENSLGGKPNILSPLTCIQKIIEEVEKGEKGKVSCNVIDSSMNYVGAKIFEDKIQLYYRKGNEVNFEILSLSSLGLIKEHIVL